MNTQRASTDKRSIGCSAWPPGTSLGCKAFRHLGEQLSRFSILLLKETDGKVKLDGRGLDSFIEICWRFAVEMARQDAMSNHCRICCERQEGAAGQHPGRHQRDGLNKEEFPHKVEIVWTCWRTISRTNLRRIETIYRLFISRDLLEQARILHEDLSELAKTKAWNDLADWKRMSRSWPTWRSGGSVTAPAPSPTN